MDVCLSYLNDANRCINSIKELPLSESVFLAFEETDNLAEENEEMTQKSVSLIQKAVGVIKGILNTIKQIIKDFVDYIKLSTAEKGMFKQFEEECKNNPEFANTKITVKNWKKINAAYDEIITAAEKEIKEMERKKEEARPSFLNFFKRGAEKAATIAKDATVELTVKKCLDMAKESQSMAKNMYTAVEGDTKFAEMLENELGQKQFKKTKKQLKKLSSESHVVRLLAGARKAKTKEQTDGFIDMFKQIKDALKMTKNVTKRNPDAKKLYDGVKSTAFDTGKEVVKQSIRTKREEKKLQKQNKKMNKYLDKAKS